MSAIISPCGKYRYRLERELTTVVAGKPQGWCVTHQRQFFICESSVGGVDVATCVVQRDYVAYIMLNPSTADAEKDDATIRKLRGFTKLFGYDRFVVGNLYAWRSKDPKELPKQPFHVAVGPDNDQHLIAITRGDPGARGASLVVAAWGSNKAVAARAPQVCKLLGDVELRALRVTESGAPEHPLYIPYDVAPRIPIYKPAYCIAPKPEAVP